MPISQFCWSGNGIGQATNNAVPIFQVFGTKRKANDVTTGQVENPVDFQPHESKRQCVWQNTTEIPPAPVVQFDNNNDISVPSQEQPPAPTQNGVSREYVEWQMNQNSQLMQASAQQETEVATDDFPMEMSDETFASPLSSSIQMERSPTPYLDTDYVPDFRQYQIKSKQCCDQPDSEYCRQYCGSGNKDGVSSNHVRCYCKPSWDAQMDLKPYVSDIY